MIHNLINKVIGDPSIREVKRARVLVERANTFETAMKALSDEDLRGLTDKFKERLGKGESLDGLLPEAFAAVREASHRTIGQRHYDVQLIAGVALHKGK